MSALPDFIQRCCRIQDEVGEDRERFAGLFRNIYSEITNFESDKIPAYSLPSPLVYDEGHKVSTAFEWMNCRRRQVLDIFKSEIYGEEIPRPDGMRFELLSEKQGALNGIACRKESRITCTMRNGKEFSFDMLLYVPMLIKKPVPVFFGLNFKGNHGCTDERDVMMTPVRFNDGTENIITRQTPEFYDESSRGCQSSRWCFEEVVRQGYASATICYEDIFPDQPFGWGDSCLTLWGDYENYYGFHEKYSSIGAWAWGISRALDCLETLPEIDSECMLLHGHSRLGKTALWAGSVDERCKLVISNDSGCLGAALSHRMYGENFFVLVNYRPHWFVKNARKYINKEYAMPFDQHFLMSLIAPRLLAVASATEDHGADPEGEFTSAVNANEVYALFGSKGLVCDEMPAPDTFVTGDISYHVRTGTHNQTPEDWAHYLEIAKRYFTK